MSQIRYWPVNVAPFSRPQELRSGAHAHSRNGKRLFSRGSFEVHWHIRQSMRKADDQDGVAGSIAWAMARQSARQLTGLSTRGATRSSGSLN